MRKAKPYGKIPVLLLVFVTFTGSLAYGEQTAIQTQEKAREVLVILPPSPSDVEKFAAEELSKYLSLSLEWKATILQNPAAEKETPRFWIGTLDDPARLKNAGFPTEKIEKYREQLIEDGVCIIGGGGGVILAGKGLRGPLNAVYIFLEKYLGIHWPEPGEEFVPKAKDIKLDGIEFVSNPAFPYRGVATHAQQWGVSDNCFANVIDWLAKNRLNGFQHFPDVYNRVRPRALADILKRGLYPNIGAHSQSYFFPASKYFKDHPEYFALVGGKRGGQLCYTNFKSVPEYAANVILYLKERPEIRMVGLWPSDGGGFCECETCKSKPATDAILDYVNRLADCINKELPDVKSEFLSYIHYTVPPVTVKPLPNVVPTYCEYWSRTQFHPITWDIDSNNKFLDELIGGAIGANKKRREQLEAWIACSKEVTIFSYYGDDCIKGFVYNPVMDVIVEDFRYYKKAGLKGHFLLLTNPDSWWSHAPDLYAYAKAVWDPRVEVEEIEKDYYNSLYGNAADAMKAHARACRALFDLTTPDGVPAAAFLEYPTSWYPRYDETKESETRKQVGDAMARIKDCLARARAASRGAPYVLDRISKLESDADYVQALFQCAYEERRAATNKAKSREIIEKLIQLTDAAWELDVIKNDDLRGYGSAKNRICLPLTRALGFSGNKTGIVYGGGSWAFAKEGAKCYHNGTETISSLPGELRDTVVARPYFRESRPGTGINLMRGGEATLFVVVDPRTTPMPDWLADSAFTKTELIVTIKTADGDLEMPVYRRTAKKNEAISLGWSRGWDVKKADHKVKVPLLMYLVFVKESGKS